MKQKLLAYVLRSICLSLLVVSCFAESTTPDDNNSAAIWRVVPLAVNETVGMQEVMPQVLPSNVSAENASISGIAYNDLNADGFWEEDEPELADWTIVLKLEGKDFREVTTDDRGFYSFEGLQLGNYTVEQKLSTGWNQTSPPEGKYCINFVLGRGIDYDFGNVKGQVLKALVPETVSHPLISRDEWKRMAEEVEAAPSYTPSALQMIMEGYAPIYPSSYSLLGYVPAYNQRNQGSCGNCWVWACTGLSEIAQYVQLGRPDRLSIQYLDSSFDGGSGRWACCGGIVSDYLNFYNSRKKFVYWNNLNAQFQDAFNHCCLSCSSSSCAALPCCSQLGCGGAGHSSVLASSISQYPNQPVGTIPNYYSVNHGIAQEQAINAIKGILTQKKALIFSFYLPSAAAWNSFANVWYSSSGVWDPAAYCGKSLSVGNGGHAALCVGYDDASDTWIMLNSWGSGGRGDGTFRVKMHMNYDCNNGGYYSYYFQWFDVPFGSNNAPSTPYAPSGPATGYAYASYAYSTSATDPDGNQVKYIFNWGDGTTSTTGLVSSGTRTSASHKWSSAGTYQVKAYATDSRGASSGYSSSLAITISANKPPYTPITPSGPATGYAYALYGYSTSVTDPDGNQVKYTFSWGDGTTSTTGLVSSGTRASASHRWSRAGIFQVKAVATDSRGAMSGWSSSISVEMDLAGSSGSNQDIAASASASKAPATRPLKPARPLRMPREAR